VAAVSRIHSAAVRPTGGIFSPDLSREFYQAFSMAMLVFSFDFSFIPIDSDSLKFLFVTSLDIRMGFGAGPLANSRNIVDMSWFLWVF